MNDREKLKNRRLRSIRRLHSIRRVPWPLKGGLLVSLALSVFTLLLYALGGMPDRSFSDETQFLLLKALRYLSFFIILFSLGALGCSVRLLVHEPRFRYAPAIGLYLLTGILGAALLTLNSLIMVAAGGNG
jgi:hypothetical protein